MSKKKKMPSKPQQKISVDSELIKVQRLGDDESKFTTKKTESKTQQKSAKGSTPKTSTKKPKGATKTTKPKTTRKQTSNKPRQNNKPTNGQTTQTPNTTNVTNTNNETTSPFPTISIVDVYIDKINNLPDSRGFRIRGGIPVYLDITPFKSLAISMLNDMVNFTENVDELENRLIDAQSDFLDAIDVIEYDSDSGTIKMSAQRVLEIIKGGILSVDESMVASDYMESLNGF